METRYSRRQQGQSPQEPETTDSYEHVEPSNVEGEVNEDEPNLVEAYQHLTTADMHTDDSQDNMLIKAP
jgi:hypothetical protein